MKTTSNIGGMMFDWKRDRFGLLLLLGLVFIASLVFFDPTSFGEGSPFFLYILGPLMMVAWPLSVLWHILSQRQKRRIAGPLLCPVISGRSFLFLSFGVIGLGLMLYFMLALIAQKMWPMLSFYVSTAIYVLAVLVFPWGPELRQNGIVFGLRFIAWPEIRSYRWSNDGALQIVHRQISTLDQVLNMPIPEPMIADVRAIIEKHLGGPT
jgi:hypothetical protein